MDCPAAGPVRIDRHGGLLESRPRSPTGWPKCRDRQGRVAAVEAAGDLDGARGWQADCGADLEGAPTSMRRARESAQGRNGRLVTRRRGPVLILAVLATAEPAVLFGSTRLAEPGRILATLPIYAGGAVLIRELARRRQAGWLQVALLGVAYGIVEEGLALGSLFNPRLFDAAQVGGTLARRQLDLGGMDARLPRGLEHLDPDPADGAAVSGASVRAVAWPGRPGRRGSGLPRRRGLPRADLPPLRRAGFRADADFVPDGVGRSRRPGTVSAEATGVRDVDGPSIWPTQFGDIRLPDCMVTARATPGRPAVPPS